MSTALLNLPIPCSFSPRGLEDARYGDTGFAILLPFVKHGVELVQDRLLAKAASWMSGRYAQNSPVKVEVACATTPADGRSSAEVFARIVLHPADAFDSLPKAA